MKGLIFTLLFCAASVWAQSPMKEFVGQAQPGAQIEHFTLTGGRSYDGIWDPAKSQIHIVVKSKHVGNLPVSPTEILSRKSVGDGSQVKIYSDVDMAEQVLLRTQDNYKAAEARLATASQVRDNLHHTYKGQNLHQTAYNAVMAQYKAADDAVASAEQAMTAARAAFTKAQEAYQKAGGKTSYSLP